MKTITMASLVLAGLLILVPAVIGQEQDVFETAGPQTKLVVQSVIPESPAEKAGILPKDVLLKYDGKPVFTLKELNEFKEQAKTDSVEVVLLRAGSEVETKLPKGKLGVYLSELLPDIKYKSDAKVIEGIAKLGWDTGKSNSFFAALEAVANYLGIKKDYTEINGASSAAFRMQFHKDWCPSSPDPTCGYNAGEDALRALGLEFEEFHISPDSSNRAELKKAILESIDRGKPVIAIDLIDTPEWGVITGYQNKGDELLCRTYFDRRDGYEIGQKFPWALYIITGKKKVPADVETYKKSFAVAVKNLKTEMFGDYYAGLAAFDKWIERLEQDDIPALDSAKFNNTLLANAWIYERLADDRKGAAEYLDKVAAQFPKVEAQLKSLATIYREESEILGKPENVVIFPFNMKSRDDWTPEMRTKELETLRDAKVKEEAALKIWEAVAKQLVR